MSNFKPFVKIVNVVVTVTLPHKLDLEAIANAFPFVEYHHERFPGAVFRLKKPRTATLLFTTGKMVCVGAKSENEAKKAVKKVIKQLRKGGILMTGKPRITVQNIVANANLGGKIDLVGFCEAGRRSGGSIIYEPEQFPAVIYRISEPKAVILIFASGKLVCTGLKKEEEVNIAVNKVLRKLKEQDLIHK
ncbi:TATA box-binding protein [Candidatus Bathyarchaeota archaeon]|nr:TATA-box-binding protein [Candidatus Bathyarchaeota archaeon]MCK4668847.1 TATA-box-binding protein [Candidatus Bathyarchaeota archaeon]TET63234.1 MAG: TATA box-binding protein [Candidatus Bathyarchaeota archaeon]